MTYDVIIPPRVKVQLRVAATWYARTSYSQEIADRWHRGFVAVLGALCNEPNRFGLAQESEHFPYDVREVLYGSGRRKTHRALFRIARARVEVLAIRHVAQRELTPDDL
jgi:plasmid stabilization system protein ParE